LYVPERLIWTPTKIWTPTVLIVAYATLGLAWQHSLDLFQATFGPKAARSLQPFIFQAATAAAFIYYAGANIVEPAYNKHTIANTLLLPESSATLYKHFRTEENTTPIHPSERFMITSLMSGSSKGVVTGLRRASVHLSTAIEPPWRTNVPDCGADHSFRVVSLGLPHDATGQVRAPCTQCLPDPKYSGERASRLQPLDALIGRSLQEMEYSTFAPYVIWRCDPPGPP